jgi:murein DD-endopeptidase MepM/ murein hydrolase activator NlpD
VDALMDANPEISNRNRIRAGQTITIPTGGKTVIVQRGDTLGQIAAKNNTSVDALMAANKDIRNANQNYPGQVVRIAGAEARPAPKVQSPQAPVAPKAPIGQTPANTASKPNTTTTVKLQTGTSAIPADKADLYRRVGDIISHGEGKYESYNAGTMHGKVKISRLNPPSGTVTNKTINEIIASGNLPATDPNRIFASGKYQKIIPTLKLAKAAMGLTGNERYTPEMQERVFREFLVGKAGGGKLNAFIDSGTGSVDRAQYAAAKEWASIAVPAGMNIAGHKDKQGVYDPGPISNGRMSYYESKANHANMDSTNQLRGILQQIDTTRTAGKSTSPAAPAPEKTQGPATVGPLQSKLGVLSKWPVSNPKLNNADKAGEGDGHYGTQRKRGQHGGVDLVGTLGQPIFASGKGVVVDIQPRVSSTYGYQVVIDHGNGVFTQYAHLQPGSLKVNPGDTVEAGQQIAGMGRSGNTPAGGDTHLHFEVRLGSPRPAAAGGKTVDPLKYLGQPN